MRSVVQRVTRAAVSVGGQEIARVGAGLLVFVGVASGDGPADVTYTASKIRDLRIFADAEGRLNQSVVEAGGQVLVISQFTLLGDVRKGRRPSFSGAAAPAEARSTYDAVVAELRAAGLDVKTGQFQSDMDVELINDGPVTILVDSRRQF